MRIARRGRQFAGLIAVAAALIAGAGHGAVAEAGGGGCHADALIESAASTIAMSDSCFSPAIARVALGDAVMWTNDDAVPHAVIGAGRSFDGGRIIDNGESVTIRFERAGIIPYYCPLHPSMVGAIVVGDDEQDVAPAAVSPGNGGDGASRGASRGAGAAGWLTLGVLAGAAGMLGTARLRRRG